MDTNDASGAPPADLEVETQQHSKLHKVSIGRSFLAVYQRGRQIYHGVAAAEVALSTALLLFAAFPDAISIGGECARASAACVAGSKSCTVLPAGLPCAASACCRPVLLLPLMLLIKLCHTLHAGFPGGI